MKYQITKLRHKQWNGRLQYLTDFYKTWKLLNLFLFFSQLSAIKFFWINERITAAVMTPNDIMDQLKSTI